MPTYTVVRFLPEILGPAQTRPALAPAQSETPLQWHRETRPPQVACLPETTAPTPFPGTNATSPSSGLARDNPCGATASRGSSSCRRRANEELSAHERPSHRARDLGIQAVVSAMVGLRCSTSHVIRLALDDLRERHPFAKSLEAALRGQVWQELETSPKRTPGARPRRPVPAPGQAGRQPAASRKGATWSVVLVDHHAMVRAGLRASWRRRPTS